MAFQDSTEHPEISLAYLSPTPQQRWSALAGAAVLLLGLAVLAPFGAIPLPQLNGFIPALDATIFVTDLVTACLLLAHFAVTRSRAILALACGYLFSALIVVAHGLAFPEAFSATGNFGGSRFTTFRLYLLWHLGLPTSIFAYVWLREKDRRMADARLPTMWSATYSVVSILALVTCIVWLATGDTLPPWLRPESGLVQSRALVILTMFFCASALFMLWRFQLSALDHWLMVVTVALMVELALTALVGGLRPRLFTLGFYTGRLFSLVTSTALLAGLLAETAKLYARLARANMLVQLAHAHRVATMGELAASIAHEVDQPLAALLINAETTVRWLDREPPDIEKAKRSVNRIVSDGKRAADIVNRIRGFSKKAPVRRESVQMNEVILDVIGFTRAALSDHSVLANMQLSEGLPSIRGDRVQLQQVVLNLVMNAIEAMSEVDDGPRELLISTSENDPKSLLVKIGDTGPGLPTGDPETMFEAFHTTKANGLGMGLSICRSIVEAHRGRLWATSNKPRGAVFCVMVPI